MKILIAAGIYPPDAGGPATHARTQYEGFPRTGVETELVVFAHYRKFPRWIRHLFFFIALFRKSLKSDVIYAHDAWGVGFPAWFAACLTWNKLVLRIGGDMAWERHASSNVSMKEWYESGAYKRDKMFKLSRFVLKQADLVVVITPILRDLYTKYYGVDGRKIQIILNPIPERRENNVEPQDSIIFASRLTHYKNLKIVLRALAKVFPLHPSLKFVIMGDGPERESLKSEVKSLKLENNVVLTGAVSLEEVLEKTASCLFTIAPALTEFNPNYVLQGVAYGKPFLISRENGLPFEIPDELLINPRDEHDIAQKISNLLEKEHYQKALEYVKSIDLKMTWDQNLAENLAQIKGIIEK